MRDINAMRMPSCDPILPASVIIANTVIQSPVDPMTAAQKNLEKIPDVINDLVVRGVESSAVIEENPSWSLATGEL